MNSITVIKKPEHFEFIHYDGSNEESISDFIGNCHTYTKEGCRLNMILRGFGGFDEHFSIFEGTYVLKDSEGNLSSEDELTFENDYIIASLGVTFKEMKDMGYMS